MLELACGSGRVTFTLAAALPMAEIVGVDSSIDMLGKAATARNAAEPLVRERCRKSKSVCSSYLNVDFSATAISSDG